MKYYITDRDLSYIVGTYDTYTEAADNIDEEKNEFIVKECPPENKLGAPNVYPFNTEEYPDGKEG